VLGSITEPPQYFSQTIRGEELGALRKLGSLRRKMLEWRFAFFRELSFAFSSPVLITIPRFLAGWKVEKLGHTTAIFRQVNKNEPLKHHDALEFPDGRTVLLTKLSEGQEATVLQLPAQPTTATEADAQKRIAYVG
jgi:hypothetical protein